MADSLIIQLEYEAVLGYNPHNNFIAVYDVYLRERNKQVEFSLWTNRVIFNDGTSQRSLTTLMGSRTLMKIPKTSLLLKIVKFYLAKKGVERYNKKEKLRIVEEGPLMKMPATQLK